MSFYFLAVMIRKALSQKSAAEVVNGSELFSLAVGRKYPATRAVQFFFLSNCSNFHNSMVSTIFVTRRRHSVVGVTCFNNTLTLIVLKRII